MGNSSKTPGNDRVLTLPQQEARMRTLFPDFKIRREVGLYFWGGEFQPVPTMDTYQVRIGYRIGQRPDVKVLYPKLEKRADGQGIPHVYPGNRLCLFKPGMGQWDGKMFLAETIVPWTTLWLYYYETWHLTGEWLGGGEHPQVKTPFRVAASAH